MRYDVRIDPDSIAQARSDSIRFARLVICHSISSHL
jgi:hypothetical protein